MLKLRKVSDMWPDKCFLHDENSFKKLATPKRLLTVGSYSREILEDAGFV